MAVQAQYPSNILLLNRNGQEQKEIDLIMGGDCLLPGEFLPQSLSMENGGFVLNRKRGREAAIANPQPSNQLSLQNRIQYPVPVNLSLPYLQQQQQEAMTSTGLRLSSENQTQQQKHQLQKLELLPSTVSTSFFSAEIKRFTDEIDQSLLSQSENLRVMLAEKREQHYRALLAAAERSAARRLKEKTDEAEKAASRNSQLEGRAVSLSGELRAWQARARAQEAVAASLQVQLRQALMEAAARDEAPECATLPAEDAESAHVDPAHNVSAAPPCRACRSRPVSVLLLPCRHLCLCSACESAVDVCPICSTVKNASMEVYLS